ncbi:calcium-binding protein [Heterostelium album PN500]|uniref:Calcium-binding protein n=1 Tax=Heterostelium pallidum (strain ATCC 26659 / Pp 5 / PN500) TaxID=670386 RepID=D3BFM9_HETP5|nr:calcium-binding protein [Heterostelium album PN500]EFA79943.1 calcium-binding protein [Heterostelium album PN500]|eukprot:XP_020432063.1 calcium-binding protein [Heterostelium album PN500]
MGGGSSKLSKHDIEYLSQQTCLSKDEVGKLFQEFKKYDTDGNGSLDRNEFIAFFKKRMPSYPSDQLVSLFEEFDSDKSGTIDFKELTVAMSVIGKGTAEDKLGLLFDIYDKDNSGTLEKNEVDQIITLMVGVGKSLGKPERDVSVFVRKLFEKLDVDKNQMISRAEWIQQGSSSPSLLLLLGINNEYQP